MPKTLSFGNGLIIFPAFTQHTASSVEVNFEPSLALLARRVDKLGADIRSFRVPLKMAIQQVVIPSIRKNFDQGGRPTWEPLSEHTIRNRKGGTQPLVRTGLLRRQMGYYKLWTVDREKAAILDLPQNIWYGKVQQAGLNKVSRRKGVKNVSTGKMGADIVEQGIHIPARPFVMLQEEDLPKIDAIFSEWVAMRVRANGLG